MAGESLNVLTICGSLRKGSYNAMVQRALPGLAPAGMALKPAPPFAGFPIYNADIQNSTGTRSSFAMEMQAPAAVMKFFKGREAPNAPMRSVPPL